MKRKKILNPNHKSESKNGKSASEKEVIHKVKQNITDNARRILISHNFNYENEGIANTNKYVDHRCAQEIFHKA